MMGKLLRLTAKKKYINKKGKNKTRYRLVKFLGNKKKNNIENMQCENASSEDGIATGLLKVPAEEYHNKVTLGILHTLQNEMI